MLKEEWSKGVGATLESRVDRAVPYKATGVLEVFESIISYIACANDLTWLGFACDLLASLSTASNNVLFT
jgi:hypothetical protein